MLAKKKRTGREREREKGIENGALIMSAAV